MAKQTHSPRKLSKSDKPPNKRIHGKSRLERLLEASIRNELAIKSAFRLIQQMHMRLLLVEPRSYEGIVPLDKGCHRSHPHEDMDAGCQRLTEIAREANLRSNMKAPAGLGDRAGLRKPSEFHNPSPYESLHDEFTALDRHYAQKACRTESDSSEVL
jgi:hypothetical protein